MEKELLFSITDKDFDVQYFCAGGHGGQNMQKNATACRIVHKESKATGVSRDERSQLQNKKKAFNRCIETEAFKKWQKIECSRRLGRYVSTQEWIDEQMNEKNLLIETVDENGRWKNDNDN